MTSGEVTEVRVKGWLSTWITPVLLTIIGGLLMAAWGDLKSTRSEDLSRIAAQRTEDQTAIAEQRRVDTAVVTQLQSDLRDLEGLARANYDLIRTLQQSIGILETVARGLADDVVDHEGRLRLLEIWRVNVTPRPAP